MPYSESDSSVSSEKRSSISVGLTATLLWQQVKNKDTSSSSTLSMISLQFAKSLKSLQTQELYNA